MNPDALDDDFNSNDGDGDDDDMEMGDSDEDDGGDSDDDADALGIGRLPRAGGAGANGVSGAMSHAGTAMTNRTQALVAGREKSNPEVRKKNDKKKRGKLKEGGYKSKEWILKKKVQMRARGRDVAKNSKFTGRKRKPRF